LVLILLGVLNESFYLFSIVVCSCTNWLYFCASWLCKEGDESVSFSSIEALSVNADVQIAYEIRAEKVPHIFVKLRKDANYITHTYIRSKVRDSLNRHASTMKVMDILGSKKEELLKIV
jgi:hypothetical protein